MSGPLTTEDLNSVLPTQSVAVDISTTDHDLTSAFPGGHPCARRIYVGTGGTFIGRKWGDTADTTYLNVPSGFYLDGAWIKVMKVGTTAAAMVAER